MGRRPRPGIAPPPGMLFIQRAAIADAITVEVDRPLAFRPRLVGFWRGNEFHLIARVVATRREHDAIYHRVLTDRGAFDLRSIRRADAVTLRFRRCWEVCAELDAVPLARLP
ncbi:MAG: hypothetical protein QME77_07315 [bacterium]|nr:hypothetical protein [bacterium]